MSYRDFEISSSSVIPALKVIKPSINWDLRGNIYSSFNKEIYEEILGYQLDFLHDKFAFSYNNVLRGLHGDNKTWKLVSCVYGEIYEVVVDMRPESPSYMKWDAFILNSEDYRQVLIPPRFINGYYVKSAHAVFHYKLAYSGNYVDAEEQITLAWNDPLLQIVWPCTDPILQVRDRFMEQK